MSTSIETSKRKFHKLLDNLTSSHPQPTPILSKDISGPATKRPRLEPRTRRNPTSITQFPRGTALTAHGTIKVGAHKTASSKPPPNYVPWSRELFLERLKTFADLRIWTSKPDAVNEVAWAKRGWVCDGLNRVACKGGCEERVVVALRPMRNDEDGAKIEGSEDYAVEIDDALVRRYEELLETGHDESCLWRDSGCKDDIYRLAIARPSIWQPQLQDRYHSFTLITDKLPPVTSISHPFDLQQVLHSLPPSFFSIETATPSEDNAKSQPINHTALSLALLGWHGSSSNTTYPTTHCGACFRRLGLWLYKPGTPGNSIDDEIEETMKLDVLHNHRHYCPWIDAQTQDMPGSFAGLAGWEILQRVVANMAEARPGSSQSQQNGEAVQQGRADADVQSETTSSKSRAEVEREDKDRFARIKELTKMMGLKGWRSKLHKQKDGG